MIDQESPNFPDTLKAVIRYSLSNVHTSFPAKVLKYSASDQKADVQPLIKKVYVDNRVESYPAIVNVPIIFPRTATAIISLPIKPGDLVLVLIMERSIDQWLEGSGKESEPISNRRFDLSDAVAIPGLYPFGNGSNAHPDSILIKNGSTSIKVDPDGKIEMGSSEAQLLDIIDQTLSEIKSTTITIPGGSSAGTYPIDNISAFTTIQNLLTLIRGTL